MEGKFSLIGLSPGGLKIKARAPTQLPKLVIVCNAVTPADEPFGRATLRVSFRGKELINAELPSEVLKDTSGSERGYFVGLMVPIAPLVIEGSGMVEVFLDTESDTIVGNRLSIEVEEVVESDQNPATA